MQIRGRAIRVNIYIDESDRWHNKPLYLAILEMLKAEDCAGATVIRALAGFGAHSRIHTANIVALSSDLPLTIAWVDEPGRVERVMPRLQNMVSEGLITVEEVEVVTYSHRDLRRLASSLPVQDLMSREVHAVPTETPILDVIELLLDKGYRALPVVDNEGRVVGIVTEGDLLKKLELLTTSARRQLTKAEMAAELQHLRRIDQTVADTMVKKPIMVNSNTTIPHAVQLMIENDIKRLPVVDDSLKLQGIISRIDILRALSQPPVAEAPLRYLSAGQSAQVEKIMVTNVPTVQENTKLAEVVELLVTNIQRRVIVIDDRQHVVGIITDGDLIKHATATERAGMIQAFSRRLLPDSTDKLYLSQRTAAEVMNNQVISVTPETALLDALQLLIKYHIKRLPVVNKEGHLVGLVGRGGILRELGRSEGLNIPTR